MQIRQVDFQFRFASFLAFVACAAVASGLAAQADASETADPRAVLRDALRESSGWVRIHAVEALTVAGEPARAREAMGPDDAALPADAPLGYRIGVWRVRAGSAADKGQRREAVDRIREAAFAPLGPDRIFAIESLAKLGWVADEEQRRALAEFAKSAGQDEAPMVWWLLGVAGDRTAKAELLKFVASPSPVARTRAAYSLKRLGGLAPHEWVRVAEAAIKPAEEPLPQAYLLAAAYTRAPSEDSASRLRDRVARLARDGTPPQRYECAAALGDRGGRDDVPLLQSLLTNDDTDTRIAAAAALLKLEGRDGAPPPPPATLPSRPLAPAAGVTFEQDVAYLAPGRIEKLDLYLPAGRPAAARSPAVVMIHGGGWVGGDKAGGREYTVGVTLAQAGYVYASVNYQLDPTDRWPTNLLDCKNAVRFLRANAERYGIDADRIGVIGSSAGGHLALLVAYTPGVAALEPAAPYPTVPSDVRAVVNLFGVTDVGSWQITDEKGNPLRPKPLPSPLFSATGGTTPEQLKGASPVTHATATAPPTLTIHGTADTTVDRGQATTLDRRLKAVGAPHETILLEGIGHSFNLTHTWEKQPLPRDLRPVVTGFFDRYLKRAE